MHRPFQTYMFHMRYTCEACRIRIVHFWTVSKYLRERAYDETPSSDPVEILAT
jgi:hypothetical protein